MSHPTSPSESSDSGGTGGVGDVGGASNSSVPHNTVNGDTATDGKDSEADCGYLVIYGEVQNGGKFRPSDWGERLYSTLRALGEEADYYANYVHLVNFNNKKCIAVAKELEEISPVLYNFYRRFAQENRLSTTEVSLQDWNAQYNVAAG